jgi:hypothetical protein
VPYCRVTAKVNAGPTVMAGADHRGEVLVVFGLDDDTSQALAHPLTVTSVHLRVYGPTSDFRPDGGVGDRFRLLPVEELMGPGRVVDRDVAEGSALPPHYVVSTAAAPDPLDVPTGRIRSSVPDLDFTV